MNRHLLLVVAAILAFGLGAILALGWFGTHAGLEDVLAADSIGLGLFAASTI